MISHILGKSNFEDDGMQNYLVLPSDFNHFKRPINSNRIIAQQFTGLPEESIKPNATSYKSLTPGIIFSGTKIQVKFKSGFKLEKIVF